MITATDSTKYFQTAGNDMLIRAGFKFTNTFFTGYRYFGNVTLRATVIAGDERISLNWYTRNFVEVLPEMSVPISDNGFLILTAVSAVEVQA
jgi:hypothetical protein